MKFKLPALPYTYDALEPYIDEKTMRIHHTKHHQGYTDKLNRAIENTSLEGKSIEEILSNVSSHADAVRNNGGGFYNHALFWKILSPESIGKPEKRSAVDIAIDREFDSFENFREAFQEKALSRFGSGWAWLIVDESSDKLSVTSTPNQDNPLMDLDHKRGTPILGLDVWEHAYYLKYQNKRADYVENFFSLIDWKMVDLMYEEVLEKDTAVVV